ncbi:uncharacterized protein NPIL_18891 [Nephila pilipes]|uniref:Uncharacterized protein n=1 Tax=Nephila pilipes TaxID=299642 RepID=A0A8X6PMI3_NEPPI|nr:uncharacterized protein NPIL_18891 [Nephila pilipes]
MAVHALIHTTGVVLDKQYIPLELSYVDVTGYEIYFHLKSPYSYDETIRQFPHARPDVIMTTKHGTSLANVLHFLQARYHQLQEQFPNTIIVFGCKGNSYQMQVLRQTGLPHLVNVEEFGVPSLKMLAQFYPFIVVPSCPCHVKPSKCARLAVLLLACYMFQQNVILPFGQM